MTLEVESAYGLLGTASAAAICAIILAMRGKSAPAGILASFAVAVMLMFNFPRLESFKGFGMEAKTREQLNEAKDILEKISDINKEYSYIIYLNMLPSGSDRKWADRLSIDCKLRSIAKLSNYRDDNIKNLRDKIFDRINDDLSSTYYFALKHGLLLSDIPRSDIDNILQKNYFNTSKSIYANLENEMNMDPRLKIVSQPYNDMIKNKIILLQKSIINAIDNCDFDDNFKSWSSGMGGIPFAYSIKMLNNP